MSDDLYINGKQASLIGIHMGSGFVNAILSPPDRKEYIRNSSRVENGDRIIPVKPRLAAKTMTLPFVIVGEGRTADLRRADFRERLRAFYAMLDTKVEIKIPSLTEEAFRLYCVAKSSTYANGRNGNIAKISIKFEEPNPANRGETDNPNA